eukprot:scaffold96031_cov27-Tisochrysis_lutea.AAC.2
MGVLCGVSWVVVDKLWVVSSVWCVGVWELGAAGMLGNQQWLPWSLVCRSCACASRDGALDVSRAPSWVGRPKAGASAKLWRIHEQVVVLGGER